MKYQRKPRLNRAGRRRQRRRGVTLVIAALSLTALIGITGFVVDLGNLYMAKAQAQRAADAAALAGAWVWTDQDTTADNAAAKAQAAAEVYARFNGFDVNGPHKVIVTSDTDAKLTNSSTENKNSTLHRATVSEEVKLYFMPFLGFRASRVSATAVARYVSDELLQINSSDNYGKTPDKVSLSVFGPLAQYSYGDPYSPKYLDDGTVNPLYDKNGYSFQVNVPATYTDPKLDVSIFDPGTHNKDGDYVKYDTANNKPLDIDEIRPPTSAVSKLPEAQGAPELTTTRYTLFYDGPNGSQQIGTADYGDETDLADMTWITPDKFELTMADFPSGAKTFHVQVQTISGSSENGFELRAGAPGTADADFSKNGTSVDAIGRVPINFDTNATFTINLANIQKNSRPNPFDVLINKFDTDVGSVDVNYVVNPKPSDMPANGYPGKLAGNGQFLQDTVTMTKDYQGGLWTANYTAGANDTSVWEVHSTIPSSHNGSVQLVE